MASIREKSSSSFILMFLKPRAGVDLLTYTPVDVGGESGWGGGGQRVYVFKPSVMVV